MILKKRDPKTSATADRGQKPKKGLMTGSLVVLGLVIVSFILVPALSDVGGMTSSVLFGRYGKQKIVYSPDSFLAREIEQARERQRREGRMGLSGNPKLERWMIWNQAFKRAVVVAGMVDAVEMAGVELAPDIINKVIIERGPFTEDGVFDERAFRRADRRYLHTLTQQTEESMKVGYFYEMLSYAYSDEKMVDFFAELRSLPERHYRYVVFPFADYPDEEVMQYGIPLAEQFRKMHLSRITTHGGEREATAIYKKIISGQESFGEMAKRHSKDVYSEEEGAWGWRYLYQLRNDLLNEKDYEALITLGEEELSPPMETEHGWLILRNNKEIVDPDMDAPDEALVEEIRRYINEFAKGTVEDYMTERAETLHNSAQESSLEEAARKAGVAVETVGPVAITYGRDPLGGEHSVAEVFSSTKIRDLATDEYALKQLFALKNEGELTDLISLEEGLVFFEFLGEKESSFAEEMRQFSGEDSPRSQLASKWRWSVRRSREETLANHFWNAKAFDNRFQEGYRRFFPDDAEQ